MLTATSTYNNGWSFMFKVDGSTTVSSVWGGELVWQNAQPGTLLLSSLLRRMMDRRDLTIR